MVRTFSRVSPALQQPGRIAGVLPNLYHLRPRVAYSQRMMAKVSIDTPSRGHEILQFTSTVMPEGSGGASVSRAQTSTCRHNILLTAWFRMAISLMKGAMVHRKME